jgi:O-antigen/teichoic acid export membrane protein
MSYQEVKRNIWSNAISNYVRTVLGMIVGLLTFRMLYQSMPPEQFGFWSLLWSVFGYGILLDFGFGFAAQKRVAELSVKQDWNELSRVLSTILFFYFGVAAVIVGVVLVASRPIVGLFGVSAANTEEFRKVLILFFLGIGLAFPMGIFPEILRGQQRIRLANNLISVALVLRLLLMWIALKYGWGFFAVMAIALFFALAPDFLAALLALKRMPGVKLRPGLFSKAMIGDTMRFSVFAYISTATNLVLGKTDQLVLGVALSVAAVALYQAGAKVAEVFSQFTKQVQDTLSPAAAHLHATGDRAALQDLLVNSTRWSVLIATPLYLLCAFYLDELLQLLTGDRVIDRKTWEVGHVLLFWYYVTILTHSVSKRIFMMTGHERALMWLGLAEAGANVVLSVGLVLWTKSVVAVAIGSLIPTLYFGWVHLWPWVARDVGISGWVLFRRTVLPSWLGTIPLLALLIGFRFVTLAPGGSVRGAMFIEGTIAGLVGAYGLWRFGLKSSERTSLTNKLGGRFRRGGATPGASTP